MAALVGERRAFVVLATGSDGGGPVHCRAWEISAEVVEQLAEGLLEVNAEPAEWIWDDTESPDAPHVLFREGGS